MPSLYREIKKKEAKNSFILTEPNFLKATPTVSTPEDAASRKIRVHCEYSWNVNVWNSRNPVRLFVGEGVISCRA